MSADGMMNKTCSIRRYTSGVSATTGGPTRVLAGDDGTSICAVQVRNQNQRELAGRNTGQAEYDVYFPIGTDVRNADILHTITDMTDIVLEVKSPPTEGVGRLTYIKCQTERVQGIKAG